MKTDPLTVLIVDDQPAVLQALGILLDLHDLPHVSASTPEAACRIASSQPLGAVIQDMNFGPNETSGKEGVSLFRALRGIDPQLPILLMTAWASVASAVELMKEGASDYIEKPWNDDRLIATLKNLLRLRELEVENEQLRAATERSRAALAEKYDLRGLVYASEEMHRLVSLATNVAGSDAPILITGPSGSGKERVAEIIQANSRRREAPFVRVNVGAIPEELIESELFGAEAGAYTGLKGRRIGHFETADQGTLFLDEIDGLSLAGQVKLLRVLQSGELLRLGSSRSLKVDVRILSATNARLDEAIRAGRFREDLFFRLNVIELALPGLRQRREDIVPLAEHFLQRFIRVEHARPVVLSDAACNALCGHDWTGNVRELENRVHRALLVARGEEILPGDLDLGGVAGTAEASDGRPADDPATASERQQVIDALHQAQGVVARAAEILGLSRQALYRRMTRLGVQLERKPRSH